jgi:hypothetical protein
MLLENLTSLWLLFSFFYSIPWNGVFQAFKKLWVLVFEEVLWKDPLVNETKGRADVFVAWVCAQNTFSLPWATRLLGGRWETGNS